MKYEPFNPAQWGDNSIRCKCRKPATGTLQGTDNAYGPYCEECALARMKRIAELGKAKKKRARDKRNHPHLHPHPAHAAYLRKLAQRTITTS